MIDKDFGTDSGGNRSYDYISLEDHQEAEKTLETKTKWSELTTNEIVVLRYKIRKLHLRKDIIDHEDRLDLIKCLIYHLEIKESLYKRIEEMQK